MENDMFKIAKGEIADEYPEALMNTILPNGYYNPRCGVGLLNIYTISMLFTVFQFRRNGEIRYALATHKYSYVNQKNDDFNNRYGLALGDHYAYGFNCVNTIAYSKEKLNHFAKQNYSTYEIIYNSMDDMIDHLDGDDSYFNNHVRFIQYILRRHNGFTGCKKGLDSMMLDYILEHEKIDKIKFFSEEESLLISNLAGLLSKPIIDINIMSNLFIMKFMQDLPILEEDIHKLVIFPSDKIPYFYPLNLRMSANYPCGSEKLLSGSVMVNKKPHRYYYYSSNIGTYSNNNIYDYPNRGYNTSSTYIFNFGKLEQYSLIYDTIVDKMQYKNPYICKYSLGLSNDQCYLLFSSRNIYHIVVEDEFSSHQIPIDGYCMYLLENLLTKYKALHRSHLTDMNVTSDSPLGIPLPIDNFWIVLDKLKNASNLDKLKTHGYINLYKVIVLLVFCSAQGIPSEMYDTINENGILLNNKDLWLKVCHCINLPCLLSPLYTNFSDQIAKRNIPISESCVTQFRSFTYESLNVDNDNFDKLHMISCFPSLEKILPNCLSKEDLCYIPLNSSPWFHSLFIVYLDDIKRKSMNYDNIKLFFQMPLFQKFRVLYSSGYIRFIKTDEDKENITRSELHDSPIASPVNADGHDVKEINKQNNQTNFIVEKATVYNKTLLNDETFKKSSYMDKICAMLDSKQSVDWNDIVFDE